MWFVEERMVTLERMLCLMNTESKFALMLLLIIPQGNYYQLFAINFYYRFFPPKLKEHLSHDVLLLCVTCHQISSRHDSIIKRQLALDYSAPLEASTHKFHEDPEKVKLRSLARALKEHKYTLPDKRKEEIMLTLADHFNCDKDEVTDDMIENLLTLETRFDC